MVQTKKHGGEIKVETMEEEGAEFIIQFQLYELGFMGSIGFMGFIFKIFLIP